LRFGPATEVTGSLTGE